MAHTFRIFIKTSISHFICLCKKLTHFSCALNSTKLICPHLCDILCWDVWSISVPICNFAHVILFPPSRWSPRRACPTLRSTSCWSTTSPSSAGWGRPTTFAWPEPVAPPSSAGPMRSPKLTLATAPDFSRLVFFELFFLDWLKGWGLCPNYMHCSCLGEFIFQAFS